MSGIWDRLGIESTTDGTAIRRAYATQLRQIDQDKDTDAFMALRSALTLALQAAAPAVPRLDPEPTTTDAVANLPPPLTPWQLAEKTKIELYSKAFMDAGQAGRTEDAFQAYQSLAAAGALNVAGGIHSAAVQLGLLAARDKTLSLDRVQAILQALGLDMMTLDRLKQHKEVAEIIALTDHRNGAERWMRLIEHWAAQKLTSWNGIRQRRRIITARYLLGTWPSKFLVRVKAIELEMKTYDQFSVWLHARLKKPERLDKAHRKKELLTLRLAAGLTSLGWIVIYFLMVATAAVAFGKNAFLIVAGPWVLFNLVRRFSIQTNPRQHSTYPTHI